MVTLRFSEPGTVLFVLTKEVLDAFQNLAEGDVITLEKVGGQIVIRKRVLALSEGARMTLAYIRRTVRERGFIWEGARPAYEDGTYDDAVLAELLAVGAIKPHQNPEKGYILGNIALDVAPDTP